MSSFPAQQLTLPLRLDDSATLANFYVPAPSQNQQILSTLAEEALPQTTYLWGGKGAGVSHLLQACCHHQQASPMAAGAPAIYLPLDQFVDHRPEDICDGLASMSLVCLDNLHTVIGEPSWAEQLFHFFNEAQQTGCRLIFGAKMSPASLQTPLADLASRVSSSLVFQVAELSDEEKSEALIFRAHRRGIDMPPKVANYLLTRETRSAGELFAILEQIDQAMFIAKRKLTVPFVKELLESRSTGE